MILNHTDEIDIYWGQGIGKKNIKQIVEFPRINKIEINLFCPLAKSVFYKSESIKDVLVRVFQMTNLYYSPTIKPLNK